MNDRHWPDLQPLRDAVRPRDEVAEQACRLRLADPPGLGRLQQLAAWLAGAQGQDPPRPLDDVRLVALGGAGALPDAHPIHALARLHGVRVRSLGLAAGGLVGGAEADDLAAAFEAGTQIVDQEVDSGADLLVPVCLGGGEGVAASLVAVLLGLSTLDVVGVPPGTDDEEWARTVAAVRDASYRGRRERKDAFGVLHCLAGADVIALTGFLVQAAVRRTPVLLDGPLICAGALAARRLVEGSQSWWLASHRSGDPAHRRTLDVLGLEPLQDLGEHLREGVGALTALGLLRSAVAVAQTS